MINDLSTLFIGRTHIHLDTTQSTNDHANQLITKNYPPEGTVISASFQTAGKGQIGRSWYGSPDKNVLCSIILYPNFLRANDQFLFNMGMACALRSTVESFVDNVPVTVKWPNDIYVRQKKISGILIQNSVSGKDYVTVVGIGLNINEATFPAQLPNPTSMKLEQSMDFDVNSVLAKLCEYVEQYYLMLQNGSGHKIHSEYNSFLYEKGAINSFQIGEGKIIDAIIEHVNFKGELVLLLEGKERAFSTGSIRYI